ncbi:hypothetical protein A2999_02400 [Candidatus Wolfebacteria bacterium RIFCSPLOWO2_01_FULL_38_11]|uniref:Enolase n=1 Tax=Candidatus Wolfebacteria bacterium RIFCSPLOWO2_01_FULL_38_11 TaxID=1802556 RepID=A0A1F8DQY7_9BACT|nr:MAG: hypothetical protein A2999_02400 [Candidatus Wolfebacteria bacterium RIFCSPLOWO2_01_FULL_38_11]
MKILNVNLRIILDSRGKDTLEAELKNGNFSAKASVPAGKSTGKHEAFVLEPKKALEKFEEIKNLILEKDFENQEAFDNFLIQLDGTENKSNLGGNLILSLSLAFARLKAKSDNLELFEYISKLQNLKPKIKNLKPIFNVINGGAHATNKQSQLDFQEFQVIPEVEDFSLAFSMGKIFYRKLGDYLIEKFGKDNVVLGDEAGYSAPFQSSEEALDILAEVIAKYKHPLRIGLDVAASQFFKGDYYLIGGKKYSAEELKGYYLKLIETYNILSIEDPFSEESFDDFAKLAQDLARSHSKTLIITDDLTATNFERLKKAINEKSGNAILIKPNQIGTLTETLKTIRLAYENNWQTIVSHRSGETRDDFIADLAVGVNAWGLKSGAPAKPERLAKYERLLAIANKTSF